MPIEGVFTNAVSTGTGVESVGSDANEAELFADDYYTAVEAPPLVF